MSDKIIRKGFINCYFSEYSTYHAAPIKDWSKRITDKVDNMRNISGMLHKKRVTGKLSKTLNIL